MKFISIILLLALSAVFVKNMFFSFRAQDPSDYTDTAPAFDLKTHLTGDILSEGLIFGPKGKMANSFVAKMVGEWDGDTGTLTEEFIYSNGKQQSRKWFLTLREGNRFTAKADDIIGEATGEVSGSTVKMTYRIVLPQEAGGHTLDVTDWLYLTESGVILNKSEMRKFGIKVTELVATMRRDTQGH